MTCKGLKGFEGFKDYSLNYHYYYYLQNPIVPHSNARRRLRRARTSLSTT